MVGAERSGLERYSVAALIVMGVISILIGTASSARVAAQKKTTGTVTGQVAIKGVGPMLEGYAILFDKAGGPPPDPARYWRVPTYTFKLDDNAEFKAEVPAGAYYIGAIEKATGDPHEPPQEGDFFFISRDRSGKPRTFVVKSRKTLQLGMTTDPKQFSLASFAAEGITAFEGIVRNDKGEPVEGLLVLAFAKPGRSERPLFVSGRSDKKGKYQLRVRGSGTYYLQARQVFAGPPAADEITGVFNNGKMVNLKTTEIKKGIDITVAAAGDVPKP